jgi:Zn-dependent protease
MGIPIRMHLTLVILLLFATFVHGIGGLLYAMAIFASVALHELGHSWVAIRKGCHVREIMLLPIGGVAKMSGLPSQPRDEFLIAAAGPATSALLALLCWGLFVLFSSVGAPLIGAFFYIPVAVNLMLCLFNLLPSFPMDGGRIFRALMTPRVGRLKATALAARIGRIMAVAFGLFGLLNGQFLLILIAIFIYNAAGAEYRAMYAQHMQQEWFTVEPQADIHVSPPPYAQKKSVFKEWKKKTNDFFGDLFKNWQE